MPQQLFPVQTVQSPRPAGKPAQRREKAPIFLSAPLKKAPGIPLSQLGLCSLPLHIGREALLASFRAAPQFSGIDPQTLLMRQRNGLRVLLLAENEYYARQCALYLSALSLQERGGPVCDEKEDFWRQSDLRLPGEDEDPEELPRRRAFRSSLAVVPSLAPEPKPSPMSPFPPPCPIFSPARLSSPALLFRPPEEASLSSDLPELLQSFLADQKPGCQIDLFLTLRPNQVDWEVVEELRFTFGFQVCQVGFPDLAYLCRFLEAEAEELMLTLAPKTDLELVVTHTQRLRGEKFTELDLCSLLLWVMQRQAQLPLTTADLLFQPYRSLSATQKELENMVALQPAKEALARLLSVFGLEKRRRMEGKPVHISCRNLAFSGPPGTGKSVTARLLAQILREEGCGTGRFVEAGREQLIGSYLGQTSHMVASLFQEAKGGVLFIDEAGSLLCGDKDQDIYAVEAVNALVRHMELSPETMVIFATYPREMEALLSSNPGLSSRVAQVLDFPGYDGPQLWEILVQFAQKEGYVLPPEAREACLAFFSALRRQKGEDFGNGREARRLYRAAVEELALRVRERPEDPAELTGADLERAAQRLLAQPGKQPARTIGF